MKRVKKISAYLYLHPFVKIKVIAGAVEELNSPTTLISIKRIDSKYRADLADQVRFTCICNAFVHF